MRNQLTDNLSSSLVPLAALACLIFGIIGVIDLSISNNATVMPALTPLLCFATILTGLATLSYHASWWLLTRLLGAAIIASAIYAAAVADTKMSVFLPPVTGMVGLVFLFASDKLLSFRLSKFIGAMLAVLSIALFISLWWRGYTTQWATNPIAVTAAMIIISLVALAFLLLPNAKRQQVQPHPTGILIASGIVVATVAIWATLSNQHIDNIKHRGELNLQKSSQVISERLTRQNEAFLRLVQRWESTDSTNLQRLVDVDTQAYFNDFELIEAIAVFEESNLMQPTSVGTGNALDVFAIESIQQWRINNFSQQSIAVVRQTLESNQPRFIMAYPITASEGQNKQVAVVFNLVKFLDIEKIPYLDYFDTYLRLNDDYYLPIAKKDFKTKSSSDLEDLHFFQLSTAFPVFGDQPMGFHAVLNSPSIFWHNATINQFILIVGLLVAGLFLATFDVNRRLNTERNKLFKLANFDSVTGLIRRGVLEDRVEEYLAQKNCGECGILFIDLDGFKAINDNLGITIGNRLLAAVAKRLQEQHQEKLDIARFGGDEFIVFLPDASTQQCKELAKQLLARIREKFVFDDVELYLTASIGISQPSSQSCAAEVLIQNADVAMGKAKEQGANTYQLFTESMGVKYEQALHLRNQIQTAIESELFDVYFQPYVTAGSSQIIGAEALARWRQSDGSFISPAEFITVAEQTGQIVPLSRLVMRKAFQYFTQLEKNSDLVLSINLSVKQFQRENITRLVSELAYEYDVPLNKLQFELTESVMVDDAQKVFSELAELRTIGCKIAIDDFGTGFSSLAYLSKLPVDVLKIDREFSRSIFTDPASKTICQSITSLAHGLNKQIIVEGIETAEQGQFFKRLGCMSLQGFYFYKPMPFESFRELLHAGNTETPIGTFSPEEK